MVMKESCLTAKDNGAQWRPDDTRDVSISVVSVGELLPSWWEVASGGKRESALVMRQRRQFTGQANCFGVRACLVWVFASAVTPNVNGRRDLGKLGMAADVCSAGEIGPTRGKHAYASQGVRHKRRSWEARLTDRRRRLQSRTWMSLPSIVARVEALQKQQIEPNRSLCCFCR
jgi:hypothetical protein